MTSAPNFWDVTTQHDAGGLSNWSNAQHSYGPDAIYNDTVALQQGIVSQSFTDDLNLLQQDNLTTKT